MSDAVIDTSPFPSSLTNVFDKNLVRWPIFCNLVADKGIASLGPRGKCVVSVCSVLDTETPKETTYEGRRIFLLIVENFSNYCLVLWVISETLLFRGSLSVDGTSLM